MELDRDESEKSVYSDCPKFDIVKQFIDNLYGKGQLTLSDICGDIHNLYLATSHKNKNCSSFWMNRSQIIDDYYLNLINNRPLFLLMVVDANGNSIFQT